MVDGTEGDGPFGERTLPCESALPGAGSGLRLGGKGGRLGEPSLPGAGSRSCQWCFLDQAAMADLLFPSRCAVLARDRSGPMPR